MIVLGEEDNEEVMSMMMKGELSPVELRQREVVHEALFHRPSLLPPPNHSPLWDAHRYGKRKRDSKNSKKVVHDDAFLHEEEYIDMLELIKRRNEEVIGSGSGIIIISGGGGCGGNSSGDEAHHRSPSGNNSS